MAIPEEVRPSVMKGIEDEIDAVICAWVGAKYVEGEARAYGDRDAAVWCPE